MFGYFEFVDNQVVDDEITCSIYVYMYTLLILLKLLKISVVVVDCDEFMFK